MHTYSHVTLCIVLYMCCKRTQVVHLSEDYKCEPQICMKYTNSVFIPHDCVRTWEHKAHSKEIQRTRQYTTPGIAQQRCHLRRIGFVLMPAISRKTVTMLHEIGNSFIFRWYSIIYWLTIRWYESYTENIIKCPSFESFDSTPFPNLCIGNRETVVIGILQREQLAIC